MPAPSSSGWWGSLPASEVKQTKGETRRSPASSMFRPRTLVQQWSFAVFLLCSPAIHCGRHAEALSYRTEKQFHFRKRTVTDAQLMHDRGRSAQDLRRRFWLQDLLGALHTAQAWELWEGGALPDDADGGSVVRSRPRADCAKDDPVGYQARRSRRTRRKRRRRKRRARTFPRRPAKSRR
ncbi:hypothetical protein AAFF_G00417910 [Aldrovandia affinis]|uniref:Parathyroid hormone-related protein n=1 Tax=Aldrovandia affinis TaxID=143900 RepID=A0AAD7SAP5_9TELE|nr:hypothetical protein AAFF_G00417910 [Aldrovandia affinis]